MKNSKQPLVLAFDCGTQSTRALLFDKSGNLIGKKKIEFKPYYSLEPGWAEQRPDLYWETICEASLGLKEKYPKEWERIIAVSATSIRDTCVCLDENKKPVRDVILWLDQRTVDTSAQIPFKIRVALTLVGLKEAIFAQSAQGVCNWIRIKEPENWKKTDKFVMLSAYINYKMSGVLIDSIASQIGHLPFNSRKKTWYGQNALHSKVFMIEDEKRCDLIEPGKLIGNITKEAAELTGLPEGLPIIASGSDKGCETLGTGCIHEGIASLSFGTTATIQLSSKKYVEPSRFMPAYPAIISDAWNPEVQIYRGFWMITWFKEQFAEKEVQQAKLLNTSPEKLLDERLSDIPAGSDGLVLQPYWSPILKNPEAKGSIIGFTDSHTRAHLYRAIIEGIGYGLVSGLREMEKRSGFEIKMLTVSGGGSSSDAVCQITADMFGLPVYRAQTYETSGLGAALTSFVAMDEFSSYEEAVDSMVHYVEPFEPNMENFRIYKRIHSEVYSKMYGKIKPMYSTLKDILN